GRFQTARQFSDALEALAVAAATTTTFPQPPGPREELRQAEHPPADTGLSEYPTHVLLGSLVDKVGPYLLPATPFALAAATWLIAVTSQSMSYGERETAYIAITLLIGLGIITALFGAVRRRLRQEALTRTNAQGETWLMRAAGDGRASLVRDLLARGAEV